MPPTKIGKYEIVRELGKGAMGLVYEAKDPHIGRKVAIKTIRFDGLSDPTLQSEMQRRFMREAQSAGILHHPNIVTIYEVGEDEGLLYIAMEFVEGRSLAQMMSSPGTLVAVDAAGLLGRVAEALDYAHRKGIIHRDVKPANILIDAEGHPRLVDFGIAHLPASTITHTGMSMGTPSYMAPEQIVGQKIDGRADVFSLGVILYELLTKEKPFPGDNVTTIIYKIMNEDPRPPREVNRGLPEGLAAVVQKALAKDPAARYQTAGEFAAALDAFAADRRAGAGDQTIVFRREAAPPPSPKPRKFPVVLVGAAAAIVLAVAFVIFLVTQKGSSPAGGLPERPGGAQGSVQPGGVDAKPGQDRPPAGSSTSSKADPKAGKTSGPDKKSGGDRPAEEPRPVRAIGDIRPPKQTRKVEAVYPEAARRAGVEGFVILEVTTDSRGRVANVKVLRSLPGCDQAAIDAVRKYLYEPVLVKGKPRGVIFSTTVFFKKDSRPGG